MNDIKPNSVALRHLTSDIQSRLNSYDRKLNSLFDIVRALDALLQLEQTNLDNVVGIHDINIKKELIPITNCGKWSGIENAIATVFSGELKYSDEIILADLFLDKPTKTVFRAQDSGIYHVHAKLQIGFSNWTYIPSALLSIYKNGSVNDINSDDYWMPLAQVLTALNCRIISLNVADYIYLNEGDEVSIHYELDPNGSTNLTTLNNKQGFFAVERINN